MEFVFLIVFTCVLNQSHGHWLLSDALHFTILMSLKLKEENKVVPSFKSLMKDDSIIVDELALLDSFLSFLMKYENKKTHNMISLMLDPGFKSLWIISSFVGWEQGVSLVEKYDKKFLHPMLVKCYEHLYPLIRSNIQILFTKIFFIKIAIWIFLNRLQTQANQWRACQERDVNFYKVSIGC